MKLIVGIHAKQGRCTAQELPRSEVRGRRAEFLAHRITTNSFRVLEARDQRPLSPFAFTGGPLNATGLDAGICLAGRDPRVRAQVSVEEIQRKGVRTLQHPASADLWSGPKRSAQLTRARVSRFAMYLLARK